VCGGACVAGHSRPWWSGGGAGRLLRAGIGGGGELGVPSFSPLRRRLRCRHGGQVGWLALGTPSTSMFSRCRGGTAGMF
jgi:hypothetical protein